MLASKSALSLEEECPSLTPTEGNPVIATEVQDLILTILKDHPYDQLKASLIKRTAASEQRRLQQVFHSEELGDSPPSCSTAFSNSLGTPRPTFHHLFSGNCSSNDFQAMYAWSWPSFRPPAP